MSNVQGPSVAPDLYDERYYTLCEGYGEFVEEGGLGLSKRLEVALSLAEVKPGMQVLDLGCGRGEMLIQCAARGARSWGVDYSPAAARIARQAARHSPGDLEQRIASQVANVKTLPFPGGVFDRVFMLDLVEHLYPWELDLALAEARRVLRDGGRLVLHTMPNRWYYRFGYPLFRLVNRLRGRRLPANPRARFEYNVQVHVNEQDVLRLRASLRRAGLAPRVWVDNLSAQALGQGLLARILGRIVRLPGFRLFLCNDLLAVATKQPSGPGPATG
jgi:ubiquinone/menaquinone biosynthesis C-methylase UbiE